MEMNPKTAMILNLVAAVLMFTTTASADLTAIFGDKWAALIIHLAAYVGGLIAAMNAVLHAYSPPKAGPAVEPATVAKVVGLIILGLLLLAPDSAYAQAQKKIGGPVGHVLDQIQGGQPQGSGDEHGGASSGGSAVGSLLDKPFQDLANFIGDDIDAAIKLSTSIPSLQDGNGQQCLTALKTFGDVVKAHPAPLTFKIASDLEAFRLKQMAINKLCTTAACTVIFADITQTAAAISPIPLPIPSLHDLCAKVPTITVVAPSAVPVSTAPAAPQ